MRKLIVLCLILSLLALPMALVLPRGAADTPNAQAGGMVSDALAPLEEHRVAVQGGEPSTPGPDLSLANYTHNRLYNPGMETWDASYNARDWNEYHSMIQCAWVAQSPSPVYQGTYSVGMQCRDTHGTQASYATLDYYNIGADMRKTNLTFYWYLDQNLYPATDHFIMFLTIRNTTTYTNYYMYYYLNGSCYQLNDTQTAHFLLDGPEKTWNRFSRNLTSDFLANPQFPQKIGPDLEVLEIYFEIFASSQTTQYLRTFLDDVYLENDTTTWIGGSTQNGNFETGNLSPWDAWDNQDPGYIYQSTTSHSGSWSANSTSLSYGNHTYTELRGYTYTRSTSLNQANLSFWWHLNIQQPSIQSQSYLYISCYDGSQYRYIFYLLGYGGSTSPYSNSSIYAVFHAPHFNTMNTWTHFSRNLWADALSYFSISELYVRYMEFRTQADLAGERVVTLIDDVRLIGHSVNGASFEDQPAAGQQLRGWTQYTNARFRVTDTAYSGSKAANYTLSTAGASALRNQQVMNRPLNGTRETYMDVMWRLEDTTAGNSFYIQLEIQNSTHYVFLYYYLCGMPVLINGTNYVYFNATGADTIGTWISLHRDLWHDYEDAGFGSLSSSHYIKELRIYGESVGGGRLELLLDDFYIYDDPAPVIGTINQVPSLPDHNEPAHIIVTHIDEQDLDTVLLHYRTDGGGWQTLPMPEATSYDADIPGQSFDTLVEYYVTANDTWGMTTTDDNNGAYYSYMVDDSTIPDITAVQHIPTAPTYLDTVTVQVDLIDEESGIDPANAVLYHRVNGGTWIPATLTHYTGNTYQGFISAQLPEDEVEYYIYVQNNAGGSNQTSTYIYVVLDLTSPSIVFYSPVSGDTVSGTVSVNVTGNDGAGTGIAYIELYIADTLVANQTSASYIYSWDTLDGTYPNGAYQLRAVAYDEAGNSASTTINATVDNFVPLPIPPILIGAIVAAVVIIIVVIVVALWFFRFRPSK